MVKIKTSVGIDSELLKWVDELVKSKRFASRSHAIEFALKCLMETYKKEGKI
jgi:Arc/MetJ-type ribon-helix-helix transcriptional regulator